MTVVVLVIVTIVLAGLAGLGWGVVWGTMVPTSPEQARDPLSRGLADMERLHRASVHDVVALASDLATQRSLGQAQDFEADLNQADRRTGRG